MAPPGAVALATGLLTWLLAGAASGAGPVAAPPAPSNPSAAPAGGARQPAARAPAAAPAMLRAHPWTSLTPAQQQALQPLAPSWDGISDGQRRKWIALSHNFQGMSTAEIGTLHARMTEWVALSPVQRSQARLNFAQTRKLSAEEKRAQWQAYQALSPEQKQQLTSGAQTLPSGAAPALKPVDPKKLAAVPARPAASAARVAQPGAGARAAAAPAPSRP